MRGSIGHPVDPLKVSIDVEGRVIRDNGCSELHGDGEGRIDYDTGDWEFNFNKPRPKGEYSPWHVGDDLFWPVKNRNLIDVSNVAPPHISNENRSGQRRA